MKTKHLIAVAGVGLLALGLPQFACAQAASDASQPFADVPADHWAYQSVDTLKKAGIVIGYPDGTYGGRRAMTRYEFAVAIARLLPMLSVDTSNFATKGDLSSAQQDLQQKLQANSDAIDALQKLVNEFQPELTKLGQDVAAVNDRLDALSARVAAVEAEQRRVKFNGALNIIAEGISATDGDVVPNQNGFPIAGDGVTADKHILAASDVYHDFVLGITGKVSDTARANVMIDFGNYLSAVGNVVSPGYSAGAPRGDEFITVSPATLYGTLSAENQQVTVWDANLQSPMSLGPLGDADVTVGRFGNQWTKYTLKQADADIYTKLYQTDSGNIPTDGVKAVLNEGPVKLNAWGGQFKAIPFAQPWGGSGGLSSYGLPGGVRFVDSGEGQFSIQPGLEGLGAPLTQGAGVRATVGDPDNWVLGVSVEQFGVDTAVEPEDAANFKTYGVLSVYGADFNGNVPFMQSAGLTLDLSWTDSAEGTKSSNFNNVGSDWRYQAMDDEIGFNVGALALKGGYQYVGPYFTAPGYWGRAGAWINPTNIEGPVASMVYKFSPKVRLNADYEGWEAAYDTGEYSPIQNYTDVEGGGRDKLTRYQVGLGFDLCNTYAIDLGYESDTYDLKNGIYAGASPTQSFFTMGIGHQINNNTMFKLQYQIAQYNDKNSSFVSAGDGTEPNSTGNILTGQLELLF